MNTKNHVSLIMMFVVLIIYSALIISSHQYERLSADATIYLDLAEKYLDGNFQDALNGYWGPMMTWLFIPFLYFGASKVFAINALTLIVGVVMIIGVWRLSYRFEISDTIRAAALLALLPIMLLYSIVEIFDFLLVCFIVYYLNVIFSNDYHKKSSSGILCGVFGALAYFSKSFAFPFFIVHFLSMNILHYIRCASQVDKKMVLRNAAVGFIVFTLIAAPWIASISKKYGHFTFSNTGKGNFASIGPDDPETGFERGVIIFHQGLFAPTNETATSIWEDPSFIWKDVVSWSPLDSARHFKHFIKNTARNAFDTLTIYESFSRLGLAVVAAYIVMLISRKFKDLLRADRLYAFLTVAIYSGGYMPFHLEHRYLWTVNILLLLMGGYILNMLFQSDFFKSNIRKNVLVVIFALSFMLTPVKSYLGAQTNNINKDMYLLSEELKEQYDIKGNIASNREWVHIDEPVHDSWHKTFRLSFWLDSRYYGQTQAEVTEEGLAAELNKFDIDYYFIWGESQDIPDFMNQYTELTGGIYPELKIYSLKERAR